MQKLMGGRKDGLFLLRRVERLISSQNISFKLLICLICMWKPFGFQIFSYCLLIIVFHGSCLICGCGFIHYLLFLCQLGYTKKQEERHFRGVITLEVCITFAFIMCYLFHVTLRWYNDHVTFALPLKQFFPVLWTLLESYTDLAKHGLM